MDKLCLIRKYQPLHTIVMLDICSVPLTHFELPLPSTISRVREHFDTSRDMPCSRLYSKFPTSNKSIASCIARFSPDPFGVASRSLGPDAISQSNEFFLYRLAVALRCRLLQRFILLRSSCQVSTTQNSCLLATNRPTGEYQRRICHAGDKGR